MGEVPSLTKLHRQYQPANFQFFIVYAREAHPGENFPHHNSEKQKLAHAQRLRDLEQIREIPILVDDFSGTMHRAYGSLPNMIYLIDRDGVVVYKSDWSDAHEIDGMCASLVRLDEMKTNKVSIIRQGISQRLHWIPMDPVERERIYRRSGEKAIQDYFHARGSLPYATDAEKNRPRE